MLSNDRLESEFAPHKPALSNAEAGAEASRCLNCYDAPCIKACPTRINIPQFIQRIGSGNTKGAAKTILEANIFGLSCADACPTEVLCEGACVYNHLKDTPITIGRLQRHAVSYAYENNIQFFTPGAPTGKRVALVGAGPASLACAHELRRLGHETVVYEKSSVAGGLNTVGIAPYKMKAESSLSEVERILAMGVQIQYGKELGIQIRLKSLTEEYDAVFLGIGLGPDRKLGIPGEDTPGVYGATDLIARIKTLPSTEMEWLRKVQTALVIGGGNTAMDACRELKSLGVGRVLVCYRRGPEQMSAYEHEFLAAREEGVEFLFNTVPTQLATRKDLNLVRVRAKLSKTDDTNKDWDQDFDLVVFATGQKHIAALESELEGLKSSPKIFSGGDLANGGKEVVNAVAEGKDAAKRIHQWLT